MITYDDFQKLEMCIGTVEKAIRVEGADKLLSLTVNIGDEKRQIAAGIAESYSPEDLEGKQIVILKNLEPKTIRGVESQGMLLAADVAGKPFLLVPEKNVPDGAEVR